MQSPVNIAREAESHLAKALALLDEREFLVDAAFVQSALDRVRDTVKVLESTAEATAPQDPNGNGADPDACDV